MRQLIAVMVLSTALFAQVTSDQGGQGENGLEEEIGSEVIAENGLITRLDRSLEPKNRTEYVQPSETRTFFIPYLQLAYGVVPGAGCCVRVQKAHLGFQIDANAATVVAAMVQEATLSLLFYPRAKPEQQWSYGGWNLGIGAGIGHWVDGRGSDLRLVCPLFAGYQGHKHSVNVVIHPIGRPFLWRVLPSVQYGWCF